MTSFNNDQLQQSEKQKNMVKSKKIKYVNLFHTINSTGETKKPL